MKKILVITALFCISLSANIYAQCTPDPTVVANNIPGLYPTPTGGIAVGEVGTAYAQTLTMIVPADTTVEFPPAPPTTVTINSSTITGVTGLPTGLVNTCVPTNCIYPGGTNGCNIFDGTPTVAGTYTVTVTVVVNVDAPFIGATDLPAQDIVYTLVVTDTGVVNCTMTVTTSSTDETVLGAMDGTATVVATGGSAPIAYLWSDPTGQTNATATGLAPGIYSVGVLDNDSCTANGSVTILAGPVGVEPVKETVFEVFPISPNPTIGGAEIRFTTPDYRTVRLTIHNLIGVLVLSKQIYSVQGLNIVAIDAKDLNPGVYVVTLTDGEKTSTKRMVVSAN